MTGLAFVLLLTLIVVTIPAILTQSLWWVWAVFNFVAGVNELAAYRKRHHLATLPKPDTSFLKSPVQLNRNSWEHAWTSYMQSDPRYSNPDSFIWHMEALNAVGAFAFMGAMIFGRKDIAIIIALMQLIGWSIYGASKYIQSRKHNNAEGFEKTKSMFLYTGIWFIVPAFLVLSEYQKNIKNNP